MSFDAYLAGERERIDRRLERLLPVIDGPPATLAEAMRYAVLGEGKRLPPILLLASFESCGGRTDDALDPACAIELIHAGAGDQRKEGLATYPALLGTSASHAESGRPTREARQALDDAGIFSDWLEALAGFVLERAH